MINSVTTLQALINLLKNLIVLYNFIQNFLSFVHSLILQIG